MHILQVGRMGNHSCNGQPVKMTLRLALALLSTLHVSSTASYVVRSVSMTTETASPDSSSSNSHRVPLDLQTPQLSSSICTWPSHLTVPMSVLALFSSCVWHESILRLGMQNRLRDTCHMLRAPCLR